MPRAALLVSVLVLCLAPLAAAEPVDEILACVRGNLPRETSEQTVAFRSQDRTGGGRTILSRMKWRRFDDGNSRALIRVQEPADLKDSGVLLIEKKDGADMFVYLPDLKKVRRVTSRMLGGKLFGSDFTYEDFIQLQGMHGEGRAEQAEDATLDGVAVHVIHHFPADGAGSSYEKVTTYIATETCVPLKSEMYEKGARLRKVLRVDPDSIFAENGVRIPQKIVMEDVRDQSSTELVVSDLSVGGRISKGAFTTSALERPGRD